MPNVRATLTPDGGSPVEMPLQFRYTLPNLQKRISVKETCTSAVIQEADTCVVISGKLIPWKIKAGCPSDYKMMYDLFTACDEEGGSVIYTFEGYWEESYEVIFYALDDEDNQSRIFDISGSFMILCVNDHPDPQNNLYP